jgi:hypothetical protein
VQLAVARQPESRLFMVRADGQCLVKLFDPGENTLGWSRLISNGASGEIESVAVLPALGEDEVYFIVHRVIDGVDVRYLEQMDPSYIADAESANCLDSYVRWESAGSTNLPSGFAQHLAGETVRVWADGAYMGENVIGATGMLTTALTQEKEVIVVGLYYEGRYRSPKLAFGAKAGTAMAQHGQPKSINLLLIDSVLSGIKIGGNFTSMTGLAELQGDVVHDHGPGLIDELTTEAIGLDAGTSLDPRLCIKFEAPFPATLQGYVLPHHLDEMVKG